MRKQFSNILVVVKQTPYEQYLQSKAQGKAHPALRWERLRNRYETHKECVDNVRVILKKAGVNFSVVSREEMHRGSLVSCVYFLDTMYNTARFLLLSLVFQIEIRLVLIYYWLWVVMEQVDILSSYRDDYSRFCVVTVLNASSFLDDSIPVLGVNSGT